MKYISNYIGLKCPDCGEMNFADFNDDTHLQLAYFNCGNCGRPVLLVKDDGSYYEVGKRVYKWQKNMTD